jgi:hypothetical protein
MHTTTSTTPTVSSPILARNKGDLLHSIDGRIISRTFCDSTYAFARILAWRVNEWDPFQTHHEVPLDRVAARLIKAEAP